MSTSTRSQRRTKTPLPHAHLGFGRSVHLADTAAAIAKERAKHAFGQEGFNVLAEIDLRDTLERTLDKDIGPYWLLDITNPMLADLSLAIDRSAGLLLPCKVAIWQEAASAVIAVLRPEAAVSITGIDALAPIAREAEQRIERALVRLEGMEVEPTADMI